MVVANTIRITKTYYKPDNNTVQYKLVTPKTTTSKRIIEVDSKVIKTLEKHIAGHAEIKMLHRKTYHEPKNGFIFTCRSIQATQSISN